MKGAILCLLSNADFSGRNIRSGSAAPVRRLQEPPLGHAVPYDSWTSRFVGYSGHSVVDPGKVRYRRQRSLACQS